MFSLHQLTNVYYQNDLHKGTPVTWQLQWGQAHWKMHTLGQHLTLEGKSFSPKDCKQSGAMQHIGINPVLPGAANPPCNAALVILICNEKEVAPVVRKRQQH